MGFTKSDQETRIPIWVFDSPNSVKRAYLREAFAMEGTVRQSLREITFAAKSYNFCLDIKNLLASLNINSFLKKKAGGTYGGMYRVSVYRKENFEKFKEIGFTAPLHVERFDLICKKYGV
ncbi:MAG: LAGLIDADG family homing endonuclease [Candidatus Woesearchaeota archaeon]